MPHGRERTDRRFMACLRSQNAMNCFSGTQLRLRIPHLYDNMHAHSGPGEWVCCQSACVCGVWAPPATAISGSVAVGRPVSRAHAADRAPRRALGSTAATRSRTAVQMRLRWRRLRPPDARPRRRQMRFGRKQPPSGTGHGSEFPAVSNQSQFSRVIQPLSPIRPRSSKLSTKDEPRFTKNRRTRS